MTDHQKRKHRRIHCSERIDIVLEDHSSFASEHITNLSEGGIFVRTSSPWPPGTVFSLGMRPSKELEAIRGTAKVVWVRATEGHDDRPIGMAASFIDLEHEAIATIRTLVEADPTEEPEYVPEEELIATEDVQLDLYPAGAYDDEPEESDGSDVTEKRLARKNLVSQFALAAAALVVIVLVLMLWLDDAESPPVVPGPGHDGALIEEVVADPDSMAVSVVDGTPAEEVALREQDAVISRTLFGELVPDSTADGSNAMAITIGATKISNVSWAKGEDVESVTIRGNADFTASQIRMTTLAAPPRCLVRIMGVEEAFYRNRITTTLDRISAVRLGHHHELDPPELHIVFDLKDSMVTPVGPILDGKSFTININLN